MADDVAAMDSGAGAHVDDVIGGSDRVLVMLDDDHRVAEVAQAPEGDEQAVVVALVEADRGLVEHVEHARQAGADLAGEADSLALAAGERARGAVEIEIVEADIVEEAEPLVDLLEDGAGDLVLGRRELFVKGFEPGEGVADGAGGGLRNMLAGDLHRQRLGTQARAVADFARGGGLVFAELLAHPRALGLEHPAVEIADDAVEGLPDLVGLAAVDEAQGDRAALGAVQDDVVDLGAEVLPRRFQLEAEFAGEAAQHLHVIGAGRVGLRPRDDRALLDAQRLVGDDQLGIEQLLLAEAVAARAGALRGVEAEQARLDLGDGEAGDRAGEFFREGDPAGGGVVLEDGALVRLLQGGGDAGAGGGDVGVCRFDGARVRPFRPDPSTMLRMVPLPVPGRICGAANSIFLPGTGRGTAGGAGGGGAVRRVEIDEAVGELQGLLEAVGEPGLDPFADDQPVDHHLDVVLVFLVERGGFLDLIELAVDAHAGEAGLLPLGKLLAILALAAADDRGEQEEPRALGQRHHPVDHLADRLGGDGKAGGGRIGNSDAGP